MTPAGKVIEIHSFIRSPMATAHIHTLFLLIFLNGFNRACVCMSLSLTLQIDGLELYYNGFYAMLKLSKATTTAIIYLSSTLILLPFVVVFLHIGAWLY
jgi:hypothetical protein